MAYDVPVDKRRAKLAKVLESYGDRVQFSVFVVDASLVRIARLRRRMEELIVTAEDSVLMCDLGNVEGVLQRRFVYIGQQRPITNSESFVQ